jgi:hypothetical protein
MMEIPARTMDYFDRKVTSLITEKYGMQEMDAIRAFISSETYWMLAQPELEIYKMSPLIVFDMWENEQVTQDPRNSLYLRSDEYEQTS